MSAVEYAQAIPRLPGSRALLEARCTGAWRGSSGMQRCDRLLVRYRQAPVEPVALEARCPKCHTLVTIVLQPGAPTAIVTPV